MSGAQDREFPHSELRRTQHSALEHSPLAQCPNRTISAPTTTTPIPNTRTALAEWIAAPNAPTWSYTTAPPS